MATAADKGDLSTRPSVQPNDAPIYNSPPYLKFLLAQVNGKFHPDWQKDPVEAKRCNLHAAHGEESFEMTDYSRA